MPVYRIEVIKSDKLHKRHRKKLVFCGKKKVTVPHTTQQTTGNGFLSFLKFALNDATTWILSCPTLIWVCKALWLQWPLAAPSAVTGLVISPASVAVKPQPWFIRKHLREQGPRTPPPTPPLSRSEHFNPTSRVFTPEAVSVHVCLLFSSSVLCWRWEEEEEEQRCSESPSSRPSLWIFTILTFFLRSHCGERRFLAGYIILYCHVGVCESQHDWAVLQWHNVKVKTHRKFRKPPKRKPRDRTSDLLAVRQTYEPLFFHPCEPYHFIILSAILLFLSLSVFALTRTKPIKPKVQTLRLLLQNARLSLHERCLWHVDHPPLIPV